MRLGIAVIDQDPTTAHVLRDEAAEAAHGFGDALLISGNDLAEVFRVTDAEVLDEFIDLAQKPRARLDLMEFNPVAAAMYRSGFFTTKHL